LKIESNTISNYEKRLARQIDKIEKEINELENTIRKLRRKEVLGMPNLSREVTIQLLRAEAERKKEELAQLRKKLDQVYYRVGIYLADKGKKLDRLARYLGKTKSELVREALEDLFAKYGW